MGSIGGHAKYTFDVANPAASQSALNGNLPWPLPFGIDKGSLRNDSIDSYQTTLGGGYSGHTDLLNGQSLAPLHWIFEVGIAAMHNHEGFYEGWSLGIYVLARGTNDRSSNCHALCPPAVNERRASRSRILSKGGNLSGHHVCCF